MTAILVGIVVLAVVPIPLALFTDRRAWRRALEEYNREEAERCRGNAERARRGERPIPSRGRLVRYH